MKNIIQNRKIRQIKDKKEYFYFARNFIVIFHLLQKIKIIDQGHADYYDQYAKLKTSIVAGSYWFFHQKFQTILLFLSF